MENCKSNNLALLLCNGTVSLFIFFIRGVPAVVDFAAMRDAVKRLGGEPDKINPLCPVDLVIDHSVQVDVSRRYCIFPLYVISLLFIFA